MTNGDRIRAFSDEELAAFLLIIEEDTQNGEVWGAEKWCLEWLKQEVEDD